MGINKTTMFYGATPKIFGYAKSLRKEMSLPELILWKKLRNRSVFPGRFRRQHAIGHFIVDFYCHKFKLVVEVDGPIHETNEAQQKDKKRDIELNKLGMKVIRFTNEQVKFEMDHVVNRILEELGTPKPPNPLKEGFNPPTP